MPSMVLTSAPSAWTASIVQDFALSPLTWTVHAPQLLVSQPMWVPVRPKFVAQQVDEQEPRLDVRFAGLAVDGDRDVMGASSSASSMRTRGRARRPCGATGRSSRRPSPACSRRGRGRPRRARSGRPPRRRRGGTAPRRVPGRRRAASASVAANGARRDAGHADPDALDRAVVGEPDDDRDADRREVADAALELAVAAADALGPARDPDLGQDLGRLDRGRERVEEEVAGLDRRARRPCRGQTIVAFAASRAAGQSEAGSAWATEPPIVPQLRTCGSPMPPDTSWMNG